MDVYGKRYSNQEFCGCSLDECGKDSSVYRESVNHVNRSRFITMTSILHFVIENCWLRTRAIFGI